MVIERPVGEPIRRPPQVGRQVRRWRGERGLTLAKVAEAANLNVGYLSQIENDKASPSLSCLSAIADALDVPIAWFLVDEAQAPEVTRAAERRWL
jgi:transcriptional regulator with XRE-family HTH domain